MNDEEALEVLRICEKLHPFMQKHLITLMEEYGPNISISVVTSVVVALMAHTITMVEVKGGDVEQFVHIIMKEVSRRQREMSAEVQTRAAMDKMLTPSGPSTCRPLH